MDETTTTDASGDKAGNPDGKQERKTRLLEVRVSTDHIGTMTLKSLNSAEFFKVLSRWYPEVVPDVGASYQATVHFTTCRDGTLQVFDNGRCILEQDSLPWVDVQGLVWYANALHEHGEVTPENFRHYDFFEDELPLYQSLVQAEGPEEEGVNAKWVRVFLKRLQTGKIPEQESFIIALLHQIGDDVEKFGPIWRGWWDDFEGHPPIIATVGPGGRGAVSFRIEIPQNEQFDINKLHFLGDSSWFDTPFRLHPAIGYNLDWFSDTLLELLEYDGKIYCRGEADWDGRILGPDILIRADLQEDNTDELADFVLDELGVEHEDYDEEED